MPTATKPVPNIEDVLDIQSFCEKYPQFTVQQLRWAIARRDTNGLADSRAMFKIGKRWYIDAEKFLEWAIYGQNNRNQ